MHLGLVIRNAVEYEFFRSSLDVAIFLLTNYAVTWLYIFSILVGLAAACGFGYCVWLTRSPVRAAVVWAQALAGGLGDLFGLVFARGSWRRIGAVASLSFREAIRSRILYVFLVFLVPFLLAGWFLPKSEDGQLLFLVAFINSAMMYILLPLVIFLVSLNMPNDIKNRTIQTIVTKPIRRGELLVGRLIGFMGIFTLVLVAMGAFSLAYLAGATTDEAKLVHWRARVPVFPDPVPVQEGMPPARILFYKNKKIDYVGTNVGKEFTYRSHIEGATDDAAIWYFFLDPTVLDEDDAGNVYIQLTFNIFKTTKGDPLREGARDSGVWCGLTVRNGLGGADGKELKDYQAFPVLNARPMTLTIPKRILTEKLDEAGRARIEVRAQCLTRNQFLGMAPADMLFLGADSSFELNFAKGLLSLWLRLLLITTLAVTASTVLKGFVTVLFVITVYITGSYYSFLVSVVTREAKGGGPLESLIRIYTQNNQVVDLDPTLFNRIALAIDNGVLSVLNAVSYVIPNLSQLDTVRYVAEGYNIPTGMILVNVLTVLGYVIPMLIAGLFLLRAREIAA